MHIVCFQTKNYCGRGKEYAEKLFDMCRRNIPDTTPFTFHCFTDDPEPYTEGIIKREPHPGLEGWWNLPYVYKNGLFPDGEMVMLLGLDTCIVSGLDDILTYDGDFGCLRDVYHPDRLQNSVTIFKSGTAGDIWDWWEKEGFRTDLPRGEQELIETVGRKVDILTDIFPGQMVSFKAQAKYDIPRGASIVYFHGHPRPHEVEGSWVEHVWKIGGGSVFEYKLVGNTHDSEINDNIIRNLSLDCELLADQYMVESDRELIIVGGGPSLEESILDINIRQKKGAVVWALNNSFRYLCERGIEPNAHILLDAREGNGNFVPQKTDALLLYCAQCHPEVIDKGMRAGTVILWSPSVEHILEILGTKRAAIVSGGSSVGLKAIGIAQLFGFKNIHLYGYDSSYRDEKNHAYQQSLNQNERIIDITVNGHKFKCAPWMATQVDEFKECIPNFVSKGMEFTVHGTGLLPYIALLLAIKPSNDINYTSET